MRHLSFLYAELLLLSADFHAEMADVLSPFGLYAPARMKGWNRATAKCNDRADGYYGQSKPQSRHLKDVLRCSVLVPDHAALVRAHAALLRAFPAAGVKDRRAEAPRDVLQVHST